MHSSAIFIFALVCAGLPNGVTMAEEPSTADRVKAFVEAVGSAVRGVENLVNKFVLDPSIREQLVKVESSFLTAVTESLECYRTATIEAKVTPQFRGVVRDLAAGLAEVIDKDTAGEIAPALDSGPVLDIAYKVVHVLTENPAIAERAREAVLSLRSSLQQARSCFVEKYSSSVRPDLRAFLGLFMDAIQQIAALPMLIIRRRFSLA